MIVKKLFKTVITINLLALGFTFGYQTVGKEKTYQLAATVTSYSFPYEY